MTPLRKLLAAITPEATWENATVILGLAVVAIVAAFALALIAVVVALWMVPL